MLFECALYAPIRERFSMLFTNFGGTAQQWESIPYCRPECAHMSEFMHQNPILISAFVHACYLMRINPGADPECVLTRPDIAGAISNADEFCSCSYDSTDSDDEWFDTAEVLNEFAL